jgi:hypothetical protein
MQTLKKKDKPCPRLKALLQAYTLVQQTEIKNVFENDLLTTY